MDTERKRRNYFYIGGILILTWILSSVFGASTYVPGLLILYGGLGIYFVGKAFFAWKEMQYEEVFCYLLLLSVLIHSAYVVYSPWDCTLHDLGQGIDLTNRELQNGHNGLIKYYYQYHRFPDFDVRSVASFYNPPCYHILAAVWLWINQLFQISTETCMENMQILSLSFTTATMVLIKKILDEFQIEPKVKLAMTSLLIFHPVFQTLSGSINNDNLAIMFSFAIVLYSIRWYKSRKRGDLLLISLGFGFGMATKLSVGLLAVPVAVLFLWCLMNDRKDWKQYIIDYSLFGLLCIPLGMFWPVRNYLLFNIPLTYVPKLPQDIEQYIGYYSLWQRIGVPPLSAIKELYFSLDPQKEYNIWMELFRTAVLDEKNYAIVKGFLDVPIRLLLWGTILSALLLNVLGIIELLKGRMMDQKMKVFFFLTNAFITVQYIRFCFQYPHICTMNFRYIVILILAPSVLAGMYLTEKKDDILWKFILGFAIFSMIPDISLMFCNCLS